MLRIWLKIKWKIIELFKLKPEEFIYWNQRSIAFGEKSVLNADSKLTLAESTDMQWANLNKVLIDLKTNSFNDVLDFGCGSGRFTIKLAEYFNCRALGLDPSEYLISIAKSSKNVQFQLLRSLKLDFEDSSFDLIFICLVFGGVKASNINAIVNELERVLKPGGHIVLAENTSLNNNTGDWITRSLGDYIELFKFASIAKKHSYLDCGEEISIFKGTKA